MQINILIITILYVVSGGRPGGYSEQDVTQFTNSNNEIMNYIVEQMDTVAGIDYELLKINHIYTQVVSGMNYKVVSDYVNKLDKSLIKRVEIVVYDQPWTKTRSVTSVNEGVPTLNVKSQHLYTYGEWKQIDKAELMDHNPELLGKIMLQLQSEYGLTGDVTISEISRVREQYIAGRMYLVDVILSNDEQYSVALYLNPWYKQYQILSTLKQ